MARVDVSPRGRRPTGIRFRFPLLFRSPSSLYLFFLLSFSLFVLPCRKKGVERGGTERKAIALVCWPTRIRSDKGYPEYDFVNGAFYTYTQVHERIRILIFHETYVCNKYLVISIYIVQIGLQLCRYRRSNSNDILKCRVQHTRYRRKKFCGE